ncbi:sigma-54-dependent transcriptional regulator [Maribacter sp. R77961]|uniref:sigma-54-dependent transcriptional regulator n=1 Tax=Maribacter sp. R77961 TaxID=3093871 RepID=UPI0037C7C084
MPKILIIEDDISFAQMLQKFLVRKNFQVQISHSGLDGEEKLKNHSYDVVLTDLRLPEYNGLQLVSKIKEKTQVIVMTGYAEVTTAVKAMKNGAYDYIAKPFTPDQILDIIAGALKVSKTVVEEKTTLNGGFSSKNEISAALKGSSYKDKLHFISEGAQELDKYISLVAPTDMSVLIVGESGTGKEVSAKAIHQSSKRKDKAFIALDCGAIPKELASSEFFGHLKGSFTGAITDKIGSFEAANGGTLFLDEVGNLSYENQIQLLRALQERKIKRIGSNKEIIVDVRVISATNEDLKKGVEKGTFREDLYHRLNEFSLRIPSLIDREGDLPIFAHQFLESANHELNKNVLDFSKDTWEIFRNYDWPGNIRELQNVVKRAVLLAVGEEIEPSVLPQEMINGPAKDKDKNLSKEEFEKEQILKALKRTNYNKSKAARLLRITRKTLYNRINHYKLEV